MAKTHVLYAHLGDNVFQSEGGKLNIIGIFAGLSNAGTIGVGQFPAVYPRVALAVGLSTTETALPLSITFRDEAGKDVLPPFSGTFNIERADAPKKTETANVNFNINFDAFQIQQPGKLFMTIETGSDELAELELNVVKAESNPPAAKT